jgi:hypothetical protein
MVCGIRIQIFAVAVRHIRSMAVKSLKSFVAVVSVDPSSFVVVNQSGNFVIVIAGADGVTTEVHRGASS